MKYTKHIKYAVFVLIVVSCSGQEVRYENKFDRFISDLDNISIRDSTRFESSNSEVHAPLTLTIDGEGRMVVVDASNWTLNLLDNDGDLIDRTGGTGGGPDEFSAINQIHFGSDKQLYVYDARSGTVSIYSILSDGFEIHDEVILPGYGSLNLSAVYRTHIGHIGVFDKLQAAYREDNNFEVYRLGTDFHLQQYLFDMPGSETYTSSGVRKKNPIGSSTFWDVENEQFYYSNSEDLSATMVNIQDGSYVQFELHGYPRPTIGEDEFAFLESVLHPTFQQEPGLEELIRKGNELPFFTNFVPSERYFYYTIFMANESQGVILRVDRNSKEMGKILVPALFNAYDAYENHLVGIDHTDGENEIMILSF